MLGRCWDRLGEPASAMSCYSQALAELIDVDDDAAEETRKLLAAAAKARATRGSGGTGHSATG
jgi:hypothetical protein